MSYTGFELNVTEVRCNDGHIVEVAAALAGDSRPVGAALDGINGGEVLTEIPGDGSATGADLEDPRIAGQIKAPEDDGAPDTQMVVGGPVADCSHELVGVGPQVGRGLAAP